MEGCEAFGGGKAGAAFDPLAFLKKPCVVFRIACLLFSVIAFGCISSKGWQFHAEKEKEDFGHLPTLFPLPPWPTSGAKVRSQSLGMATKTSEELFCFHSCPYLPGVGARCSACKDTGWGSKLHLEILKQPQLGENTRAMTRTAMLSHPFNNKVVTPSSSKSNTRKGKMSKLPAALET